MKEWLVIIASVILGVILWNFILGDNDSLKTGSQSIMDEARTQIETIQP